MLPTLRKNTDTEISDIPIKSNNKFHFQLPLYSQEHFYPISYIKKQGAFPGMSIYLIASNNVFFLIFRYEFYRCIRIQFSFITRIQVF